MALTFQFTAVWVWTYYYDFCLLPLLRQRLWATAFEPHARIVWWILTRQPLTLWIVPVGLAMYLAIRRFRLPVFMCVLFIGLSLPPMLSHAVFPSNFFVTHVRIGLWVLAAWWLPNIGHPVDVWRIREWCLALVASVPLVLAVWAAQFSKRQVRENIVPS